MKKTGIIIKSKVPQLLKAVEGGRALTPHQRNIYAKAIKERVKKVRQENRQSGLEPYIDLSHTCETCLSKDGKCHPKTGYCWHCDTDNWLRNLKYG